MRQVDEIIATAFKACKNAACGNTSVQVSNSFVRVFLHGNKIAQKNRKTGKTTYSTCGYNTNVTANRLRALGCDCYMKNKKIIMP